MQGCDLITTEVPKISIVTPSFNQGRFLEQTILSVTGGNYPNLEYVVMDGGSTDTSVSILEKYSDRISSWVSEKDEGQYSAINKGFGRTSGEIMAWLNSDDIYLPWTISLVGEIFSLFPHVDWLTTALPMYIDEKGNAITHNKIHGFTRNGFLRGDNLQDCGWEGLFIQQESTFWRRTLWDKVGGLDSSFRYAGDFDLWARFFEHAKLFVADVPLGCFRKHDAQKTSTAYDIYREEALESFKKHGGCPPNRLMQILRNRIRSGLPPEIRHRFVKMGVMRQAPRILYDWGSSRWLITE